MFSLLEKPVGIGVIMWVPPKTAHGCKTSCIGAQAAQPAIYDSVVFLQSNSLTITIVSQKYWELLQPYSNDCFSKKIENFLCKWKLENNCSIPSTHAEKQINDLSVKHSFTLYPSLSPYRQMESRTEKWIHLLRVGWRIFFCSCAVVSVFWLWREIGLGLITYCIPVVVLCHFFGCDRK